MSTLAQVHKTITCACLCMCVHVSTDGFINILQATQHFSISCLGSSCRGDAVGSAGLVLAEELKHAC